MYEFLNHSETNWLFVPFLGRVEGTPVRRDGPSLRAFHYTGPLQELSEFSGVEFFISPPDLSWTFVRTHEDFAFGGPYFVRAEWVEEMRDPNVSGTTNTFGCLMLGDAATLPATPAIC